MKTNDTPPADFTVFSEPQQPASTKSIQSTKAIRFILHLNLWGAVALFLAGLANSGSQFGNSNGAINSTAAVTYFALLLLEFAPWIWLCAHALKTLRILRDQAQTHQ